MHIHLTSSVRPAHQRGARASLPSLPALLCSSPRHSCHGSAGLVHIRVSLLISLPACLRSNRLPASRVASSRPSATQRRLPSRSSLSIFRTCSQVRFAATASSDSVSTRLYSCYPFQDGATEPSSLHALLCDRSWRIADLYDPASPRSSRWLARSCCRASFACREVRRLPLFRKSAEDRAAQAVRTCLQRASPPLLKRPSFS